MSSSSCCFPTPALEQNYVTVSALHSGILTLPSHLFISPTSPSARHTVPSLSFLIQHHTSRNDSENGSSPTRLLFDLGLRSPLSAYPTQIRKHIETRHPISSDHDVIRSLTQGSLQPDDVDWVILSHVHWDHVGTPSLFPKSYFIVGAGTLDLLRDSGDQSSGGHAHFEADLLPEGRVVELPRPAALDSPTTTQKITDGTKGRDYDPIADLRSARWQPLAHFPHAIDVFGDGSLYLIDAPGHLAGHTNLLARIGPKKWAYLAGDACHDRQILTGEVDIATWENAEGKICCIHSDVEETEKTLERIRSLSSTSEEVEVILAHDVDWAEDKANEARFWPGTL